MRSFWVVPGSEGNWRQAFASRGIWGLEEHGIDRVYWLAVAPNDVLLFYVAGAVKRVVGYGIVRNRFYQNVPLWREEIDQGSVKWPLRFEFDIQFLVPEGRWREDGFPFGRRGAFRQPLILEDWSSAQGIIRAIDPRANLETLQPATTVLAAGEAGVASPTHEQLKALLVEIGTLQGYIANSEFPMAGARLDVVWRRLPESVPTYAFEIQVGGDVYHALGKLKHARDVWNSRIFIVAPESAFAPIKELLAGTFHEIGLVLRIIGAEKVMSLHTSKRNIYEIERDLGLIG